MRDNDRRLIEDYLPIEAISAEASREKSVRKGHISTLHLWWAGRPLVACRAAVYGALVPASRFAPEGASEKSRRNPVSVHQNPKSGVKSGGRLESRWFF
jgi:putative DNA methylase